MPNSNNTVMAIIPRPGLSVMNVESKGRPPLGLPIQQQMIFLDEGEEIAAATSWLLTGGSPTTGRC